MVSYTIEDIRNIAIVGHGSSGKTTLIETLMHRSGAINQMGSIERGSTVCDFNPQEKTHKQTKHLKVTSFLHVKGRLVNGKSILVKKTLYT